MSLRWYCEGPGCVTFQRPTPRWGEYGWLVVNDGATKHHLCSRDCLMRWAAGSEPLETTPIGGQ